MHFFLTFLDVSGATRPEEPARTLKSSVTVKKGGNYASTNANRIVVKMKIL